MKRVLFLLLMLQIYVYPEGGYISSYAVLNTGSGNTYYDLSAATGNPDFHNNNLGSYLSSATLLLKGAEVNVWENDGHNIAWSRVYYSIYPASGSATTWNYIGLTLRNQSGNDEKWDEIGQSINLLSGLSPGDYRIAIYVHTRWEKYQNDLEYYLNNSGANYVANFSVVANKTTGTGDWNTASSWDQNIVPQALDYVEINHDMSVDVSDAFSGPLTVASGKTLTIGANNLSASTNSISGSGAITISTGTLTGGAISVATLTTSGSATINASGDWGVTNFTKSTSTVNFTGSGNYSTATNFFNLTVSSGTRTMNANMDVEASLTISGTATLGANSSRTLTTSGNNSIIDVTSSNGLQGADYGDGNLISLHVSGDETILQGETGLIYHSFKFYSILVDEGCTLAVSRGFICRYGTFIINGTFQINLNGYAAQQGLAPSYGSGGILKYNTGQSYNQTIEWLVGQPYVTVANGTTVVMTSDRSVSGELKLEDGGKVVLGTNNLTIGSGATVVGDATSFIVTNSTGQLRKEFSGTGTFTFPIGENTGDAEYSPVTLNFTSGTFNSAYAGVTVTDAKHSDNGSTTHFISRYWVVTSSGISDFSASASFVYVDADINGTEGNLYLGKWNGSTWSLLNAVETNTNTLSGTVTSFSEFTGGESSALPVELTSFNGKVVNSKINLNWNTATEVNNYGFEVERAKAVSGNQSVQFAKVGFVEGNGNSNSPKSYSFTDINVTSGKYVYRLKQIDTDGQFEYSQEIEVSVDNLINGYVLEQNYPNPFNPATSIKFGFQTDTRAEVKVYNVIGAEVATLFNGMADAGRIYEVTFDAGGLASGTYFYKLVTTGKTDVRKMILMK